MYKKILTPVDGIGKIERSFLALDRAMLFGDAEIILLHVTEPVPQTVGGEARIELEAENNAKGLLVLAPLIDKLQETDAHFHTRVVPGAPAETIAAVADEEGADLIVMVTDGHDNLSDMLLGSITDRVLRNVSIDLLAVRNTVKDD